MIDIQPFFGISDPVSSLSHYFGALVFLILNLFLLKKSWGNHFRFVGLLMYSFSLIFLFSMSGTYHLLEKGFEPRHVLRHLDHAAIWILIASSFLPIHLILLRGIWRWGILLMVWVFAISGLVLTTIFFDSTPTALKLAFYLGLGWIGIFSGIKLLRTFGVRDTQYLMIGGFAYSLGAILDEIQWPVIFPGVFGPHEIFHVFVLIGALSHWIYIYNISDHPISVSLTFNVYERPNNYYLAQSVGESIQVESFSKKDLHNQIVQKVKQKYHPNIRPNQIICRYFKEEVVDI